MNISNLTPRLIVADVDAAISFLKTAMGAELVERYADDARGLVVHAAVRIGDMTVSFAQEKRDWGNLAPGSLGGSPMLLSIETDDAHALGKAMVGAGAEVVVPVADQFYGKREGRLRDPSGHLWIVSQVLEELTPEEIHERMKGS